MPPGQKGCCYGGSAWCSRPHLSAGHCGTWLPMDWCLCEAVKMALRGTGPAQPYPVRPQGGSRQPLLGESGCRACCYLSHKAPPQPPEHTCLFFCMCAHACGTHNSVCMCACVHMCVLLSLGSCIAVCTAGRWLRALHMYVYWACTNVLVALGSCVHVIVTRVHVCHGSTCLAAIRDLLATIPLWT